MAKKGRATFPKPDRGYTIPDDLKLIGEYDAGKVMTGQILVVVEGERLPPWSPGTIPWSFQSLLDLLRFREGNHG